MVSAPHNGIKVVEAVGLTKVFRDFWMRAKATAVDNVDFDVYSNEIFGLLGPNGSGKSTIIKLILGLLHKTRGRLLVFGKNPDDVRIKRRIGFLPEESYMYQFLNPRETLDYYGKLFGLDRATRRRRTDELLEMVGLSQVAHRPIGEFSKGMTRRIGLAQALINDPDFLILDEPTSGLDPIGTRQVKDLIIDLGRRGKTILLSSHLLADVEDVCDRMVMLYGGKIRAQGTAEELLRDTEHTVIRSGRLKPETVSAIRTVVQQHEGFELDAVEAPRQRLEQLFMDIVERAQQERVATSGALHGGQTAQFLRGEHAEGGALIDTLLHEDAAPTRAVEKTQTGEAGAPDEPDEGVVESLINGDEAADGPDESADADRAASAGTERQRDVDSAVIDSLLDDDDDTDTDDEPRARDKRPGG
jgi:ABC-2 type transport system ATP-binding protein